MSLPAEVIDRLFSLLTLTYGRSFLDQWAGQTANDVKTFWGYELAEFNGRLKPIAWALESLPERCPNVITFRNLARSAPRLTAPTLPEPPADPARLRAELAKLAPVRSATVAVGSTYDNKAWAKRIIDRSKAGDNLAPCVLRFANQALRTHLAAGAV